MSRKNYVELMRDTGATRLALLNSMRRFQTLEELRRKAQKAKRKGWARTQEEDDLAIVQCWQALASLYP